ncbi:MAG: efflux RND transporter periplasmic adaptor subunit [Desulfobacterales bacterium]|nr:efflux RND transporter periplasmic adaptor subunit [Desulfobacterales bacterium]
MKLLATRKMVLWAVLIIAVGLVIYRIRFMPLSVSVHRVSKGQVIVEVMGTGTLEARTRSTVSSKIQGRLTQILADQNMSVKKGQILARTDDGELIEQVNIAEASLNSARATAERVKTDEVRAKVFLSQAKRDYQRYIKLSESKTVSESDLEKNREKLLIAEADISKASATITEAMLQIVTAEKNLLYHRLRLENTQILSPFDGCVVRRNMEAGDIVVPGASVFELISTDEMWISAWVDESAMSGLAADQSARIVFRSEPSKSYLGKVVRLGREVDRETREFIVDVRIEHLPENWAVGQRAEVYIEINRKSDVLLIPSRMIVWCDGKSGVYVVINKKAVWKEVKFGLKGFDVSEITEGLSLNDIVIASFYEKLRDGKRVVIK